MTLKVQRSVGRGRVIFTLSGRITAALVPDLEAFITSDRRDVVLDLKEIRLVDRDAVLFLARCESAGVDLDNCPAYIREWIDREREATA